MAAMLDGSHHLASHLFRSEQNRIFGVIAQKFCGHETRSQVGERDFQASHVGLLLKRLDVCVLQCLGGRIGRCGSQSLGAGNAADDGDVASTMLSHVTIGSTYHACESHAVYVHGFQLDFRLQIHVLVPNSRGIEEQIHSAHLLDERIQSLRCLVARHVDGMHLHPIGSQSLNLFKPLDTARGDAQLHPIGKQQFGNFLTKSR